MGLENTRYVKLDLTFGEKIKLLLFGLIKEDCLPVREVVKEVVKEVEVIREVKPKTTISSELQNINTKTEEEEKLVIPFFNFNDNDVKSNF